MSLRINVDKVKQVLLADGWHKVIDGSFDIDAYEFLWNDTVLVGGGTVQGVPSTGAMWTEEDGSYIACPLTAILAVKV
jgi:hypothetical protein